MINKGIFAKLKDKEVRSEIKLAKKVAKTKAKEVVSEAKRIAKETEDRALAKQIVKSAKSYGREIVKNAKSKAKECYSVEEVKEVIEKETAINVEKCVETVKERAKKIIAEKKARKSNSFFGQMKKMVQIKKIIAQMFLDKDVSDFAKDFIEKTSFNEFCSMISDIIENIDITKDEVIRAMRKIIYGESNEKEGEIIDGVATEGGAQ